MPTAVEAPTEAAAMETAAMEAATKAAVMEVGVAKTAAEPTTTPAPTANPAPTATPAPAPIRVTVGVIGIVVGIIRVTITRVGGRITISITGPIARLVLRRSQLRRCDCGGRSGRYDGPGK